MYDLTGFQRDLLIVLAGIGQSNGLEIRDELQAARGEEIHHGRVYPNLDTLADLGLIAVGDVDARTNAYQLTDRGHREIRAHRRWVGSHVE